NSSWRASRRSVQFAGDQRVLPVHGPADTKFLPEKGNRVSGGDLGAVSRKKTHVFGVASMPGVLTEFLQRLRCSLHPHTGAEATDAELLRRFLDGREEAAFAVLVQRHGPMVLNV